MLTKRQAFITHGALQSTSGMGHAHAHARMHLHIHSHTHAHAHALTHTHIHAHRLLTHLFPPLRVQSTGYSDLLFISQKHTLSLGYLSYIPSHVFSSSLIHCYLFNLTLFFSCIPSLKEAGKQSKEVIQVFLTIL